MPAAPESAWRSPLLSPALAATAGVALDRSLEPPFAAGLATGGVALVAAVLFRSARLGTVYFLAAVAALGGTYHAWRCRLVRADDVAHLAGRQKTPARLRGVVADGPHRPPPPAADRRPLYSQKAAPSAWLLLDVHSLGDAPASGVVRVNVSGKEGTSAAALLAGLRSGDEAEAIGQLALVEPPGNPGEFDPSYAWSAQGVRATLRARPDAVRKTADGWHVSPRGWLAAAREAAASALRRSLADPEIEPLGHALLLGEGAPMTPDGWAKYVRTGVVHVVSISGQHLVVIAWLAWLVLARLGVRQRYAVAVIACAVLAYAVLTGARPSALRAVAVACALCGALLARRRTTSANLFAFAWLVVGLVNPASVFEAGCQLSFLAVALLAWCAPRFFPDAPADPLDALIDRSRPPWLRLGRQVLAQAGKAYAVNLIVWLAIVPLAAHHSGIVAPSALLLGPPLALLTGVALVIGFALLALAPFGLGWLLSYPLWWSLAGCEWLVDGADSCNLHVYCGQVPAWWLLAFYAGLFAVFASPPLLARWRRLAPAGVAWLALLLVLGATGRPARELRVAFLDVGHGGCAVVRTPDGRVLLYDVGAIRGPDAVRRVVAPYLWGEGVSRIDDVVLSHPDLDHFNGLADLAERFALGRVLTSDSFFDRKTPAIEVTRDRLRRHGVPVERLGAGDRLSAGEASIDVLHPPRGFVGTTNEESVVLLLTHAGRSVLLTGDLEGAGLAALLRQPARRTDVIQAPHHGSSKPDAEGLLRWCSPRLAVSCQAAPADGRTAERYHKVGVEFWTTWKHGAVSVSVGPDGVSAAGHRGGQGRWE